MANGSLPLRDGDRIAVIGGGPAGTFFSFAAARRIQELGRDLSITLFDGKHFEQQGPPGCNMCAGVISETLAEKLHDVGLSPPGDKIQVEIERYNLSTPYYGITLYKRRRRFPIYTVYRGNGPRDLITQGNVSFDDYLLDQCRLQGVQIVGQMVKEIHLPTSRDAPVTLILGKDGAPFEAQLLVIACGLNTRFLERLSELGFDYRPPRMVYTCQAEIPVPKELMQSRFGTGITTFALGKGQIRFAAFTPKQQHLTLTIVGKSDVSLDELQAVLQHPRIRDDYLAGISVPPAICFCRPKIAVSPARQPFTDRLVVVGDAAYSRYYKNGIESAFDTARLAASCALEHGVSKIDFRRHYLCRELKEIKNSSKYGRFIFACYDVIFQSRLLSSSLVSLLAHRRNSLSSRQMVSVLWALFTGNIAYRRILGILFQPRLQARMFLETLRVLGRKFIRGRGAVDGATRISSEVDPLGPLGTGQTVVVIGGGPGGVGCAIALKKFSAQRGVNINVVIYEGKDFETQPHYNQCVGVLSPPIIQILEKELGVPFPYQLTQREIHGYVLHSDSRELRLPSEEEPSISVRRVTFDNYLLQQARARGIEIIKSRVTDLEFSAEGVMVYSETDNRRADVVVGAFGLDDGTAKIFERVTAYRQPRFLNSIVTKIHPGEELVAHFENYIHAFLPSRREIEFGAVTPKKDHLTINVAGAEVTAESLQDFLNMPEVRRVLPASQHWDPGKINYFKGKFPIRVAQNYFGDRYVMVGDAAGLLRPFKGKGVNMGILTGMRAARTILDVGISRKAFEDFHNKCKDITGDLPYGKLMRFVALRLANWKVLDPVLEVGRENKKLQRALYDSISAHQTYRKILKETWDLRLFARLFTAIVSYGAKRLRKSLTHERRMTVAEKGR